VCVLLLHRTWPEVVPEVVISDERFNLVNKAGPNRSQAGRLQHLGELLHFLASDEIVMTGTRFISEIQSMSVCIVLHAQLSSSKGYYTTISAVFITY
jgi:hypothetical protein